MKLRFGEFCPKEFGRKRGRACLIDAALEPDLSGLMVLPVGKQTDAIGARENFIDDFFQRSVLRLSNSSAL